MEYQTGWNTKRVFNIYAYGLEGVEFVHPLVLFNFYIYWIYRLQQAKFYEPIEAFFICNPMFEI